jgi:hypothetical protein
MGLSWGLGGIVGSIIGGLAENPVHLFFVSALVVGGKADFSRLQVRNHPRFFGDSVLFAEYPYLLPCLIAGSVTTSGAVLSLFLNPDGGPRTGAIHLPSEKDVERAARSFGSLRRFLSSKISSFFARTPPIHIESTPSAVSLHPSSGAPPPPPAPSRLTPDERSPLGVRRPSSRFAGSAYGYNRPVSEAGMRIVSTRRYTGRSGYRAASFATSNPYAPDYDFDRGEFSFAER